MDPPNGPCGAAAAVQTAAVAVDRLTSVVALAGVLDAANGFADGKSLHTALFAFDLATSTGHGAHAADAFCAGLLRHLGCTAYAEQEAHLGDDVTLRQALHEQRSPARAVAAANATASSKAVGLARLVVSAGRMRREWTAEACGAGAALATSLGFNAAVVAGIRQVFERFDGEMDLHIVARLATVAHTAVVFARTAGVRRAVEVLRADAGRMLDPALVPAAIELLQLDEQDSAEQLQQTTTTVARALPPFSPLTLATTFGDFADLQCRQWAGHTRDVADVAVAVARTAGLSVRAQEQLQWAAHLHDLGTVGVSTSIWQRKTWQPADRLAANAHGDVGARLLRGAPWFVELADVVEHHHERLDGSGPHRCGGAQLGTEARLLAVADVWVALQQHRPHRRARSASEARQVLVEEARAGRLDRDLVEVVVQRRVGSAPPATPSTLTAREVEVLRLVASGLTNKEIAARLSLSSRTVQHHTIHIYEKLGVNTRAAATLWAAHRGLLSSLLER